MSKIDMDATSIGADEASSKTREYGLLGVRIIAASAIGLAAASIAGGKFAEAQALEHERQETVALEEFQQAEQLWEDEHRVSQEEVDAFLESRRNNPYSLLEFADQLGLEDVPSLSELTQQGVDNLGLIDETYEKVVAAIDERDMFMVRFDEPRDYFVHFEEAVEHDRAAEELRERAEAASGMAVGSGIVAAGAVAGSAVIARGGRKDKTA